MAIGLNRSAVNNSLLALKNYAVEDKGMKVTFSCFVFFFFLFFFFFFNLSLVGL